MPRSHAQAKTYIATPVPAFFMRLQTAHGQQFKNRQFAEL
jgi:hypothetical protein